MAHVCHFGTLAKLFKRKNSDFHILKNAQNFRVWNSWVLSHQKVRRIMKSEKRPFCERFKDTHKSIDSMIIDLEDRRKVIFQRVDGELTNAYHPDSYGTQALRECESIVKSALCEIADYDKMIGRLESLRRQP